jgi:hypothetical protein
MNRPKRRLNLSVALGVVVSVGLYGTSLFLPAVEVVDDETSVLPGWHTLALAPLICRECVTSAWQADDFWRTFFGFWTAYHASVWSALFIPWLANPLLLAGTIFLFLRRWPCAWVTGALAILCVLYLPWIRHWYSEEVGENPKLLPGYYLWLGSMVVLTVVGVYQAVRYRRALNARENDALRRPTL